MNNKDSFSDSVSDDDNVGGDCFVSPSILKPALSPISKSNTQEDPEEIPVIDTPSYQTEVNFNEMTSDEEESEHDSLNINRADLKPTKSNRLNSRRINEHSDDNYSDTDSENISPNTMRKSISQSVSADLIRVKPPIKPPTTGPSGPRRPIRGVGPRRPMPKRENPKEKVETEKPPEAVVDKPPPSHVQFVQDINIDRKIINYIEPDFDTIPPYLFMINSKRTLRGKTVTYQLLFNNYIMYSAQTKSNEATVSVNKEATASPKNYVILVGNKNSDFSLRENKTTGIELMTVRIYPVQNKSSTKCGQNLFIFEQEEDNPSQVAMVGRKMPNNPKYWMYYDRSNNRPKIRVEYVNNYSIRIVALDSISKIHSFILGFSIFRSNKFEELKSLNEK